MKKLLSTKHVVSSLIIVLCTMFKTAFAQSGPPIYYGGECLNDVTMVPAGNQTLSTMNSEYGGALPTSGTFRILVIFAEIDYTGSGYTDPTTSTDPFPLHHFNFFVCQIIKLIYNLIYSVLTVINFTL